MPQAATEIDVSVIVPARNEEANLAGCLHTLVGQDGISYEVIVVDDHSTDRTSEIAESFAVRVIMADPLPEGWSGKCNAAWSGAKIAKGKWLLFTDADTRHSSVSIVRGVQEATEQRSDLLSYSPRQEVHGFAEHALMPVIFAELARTYRPQEVRDPNSAVAAANGQYLLIRRKAYDAIGGHAAVAQAILEDVELARLVKQAGYRLWFQQSAVVSTRMYRSLPQMWEGWTKNLALLFPNPRWLALRRSVEFLLISVCILAVFNSALERDPTGLLVNGLLVTMFLLFFYRRIRLAHFEGRSNILAFFGLPLFALLLLNSYISHKGGTIRWKGRRYGSPGRNRLMAGHAAGTPFQESQGVGDHNKSGFLEG